MNPVLRRRIAALLLLAGIAVAALAIADVGPFKDPVTEEQRAEHVVTDVFAAAAAGNGEKFCGLLTSDARHAIEIAMAQRLQTDETPKCERIVQLLAAAYKGSSVDISYVNVSGNRARVEARLKFPGHGAEPRTLALIEQNDEWRITDLDVG
ncbi:MAG: nuclear transport factor 2 family protein [Solirubrobacterales bacterium]